MKSAESRDVGRAVGTTLRQLSGLVRGAHFAVSDTVHDAVAATVGPAARPVRIVQDSVTAGVYAAVGLGLDAAARLAGHGGAHLLREDDARPSIHDGRSAHHILAVGLGLRGDTLAREAASVAPAMQVRRSGRRVELTPEGVRAAYPLARSGIAVFVHGLFETEHAWRLGTGDRLSYAARLESELGLSPVMVRYNTGLRVSENSADLAALLADLVAAWPVPVTRIVLIGHSMGGLLIHGALAVADDDVARGADVPWRGLVTDTVSLGTPHHGSPVARGVAQAAGRLGRWERGRWLAEFLDLRSGGVHDLVHGNVAAADWRDFLPGDLADHRTHPVPAAGVRHHAVVAVTAAGRVPPGLADRIGDVVVPADSASHAGPDPERRRFEGDRIAVVPGLGHLGLLNSDRVYAHLVRWLGPGG